MSESCQIIEVVFRHALTGTWVLPDDACAEYTVTALGDLCTVTGIDTSDGEVFVISDVLWNGRELQFTSLMPSTQYRLKHIFRVASEEQIEHEWTRIERWVRKTLKTKSLNPAVDANGGGTSPTSCAQ